MTSRPGAAERARSLLAAQPGRLQQWLRELVELETPAGSLPHLERCSSWLTGQLELAGARTSVEQTPAGPHILARLGAAEAAGPCPLVLCHYDTVFEAGSISSRPFAIDGDIATGPGVLDMKGGITALLGALTALSADQGTSPAAWLSFTPDEEVGNPQTRGHLEDLASSSSAVLVLEPATDEGHLKTARKAIATIHLRVRGRAAHAGLNPEDGVNAAVELSRLAIRAAALSSPETGAILNVATLRAGTLPNVVPALAEMVVELRAWSDDDMDTALARLSEIAADTGEAVAEMTVTPHRPAMTRSAAGGALTRRAQHIAAELGLTLAEARVGGGSEANFAARTGAPTLDGLGPVGGGAHSEREFIRLPSIIERGALLAGLLTSLTAQPLRP